MSLEGKGVVLPIKEARNVPVGVVPKIIEGDSKDGKAHLLDMLDERELYHKLWEDCVSQISSLTVSLSIGEEKFSPSMKSLIYLSPPTSTTRNPTKG